MLESSAVIEPRSFVGFVGIDLGGSRGKSTAVAVLRGGDDMASVQSVHMRGPLHSAKLGKPWTDSALLTFLDSFSPKETIIAINAPLTSPACGRCTLQQCPGEASCPDAATIWLSGSGQELQRQHVLTDSSRIAVPLQGSGFHQDSPAPPAASQRLPPYTHRCTEVELHYGRGLLPREQLSQGSLAITSRASYLRRNLAKRGFALHEGLLEVSPRCTVHALFGADTAQTYKRDADPWHTRARIIEGLKSLHFEPTSGLSREDVLRNDNCFDALVSAYTAFLKVRDSWTMPDGEPFFSDGWIWAPPRA